MRITVLRGISGSGKSTWAKNNAGDALVVSADHFFLIDGEYRFDPAKLQENHAKCFKKFMEGVLRSEAHIVVDNTNIESWEYSPYVQAGEAFAYEVELLTLECSVEVAHSRKKLIERKTLERLHTNLTRETEDMPRRFQKIHRIETVC